MNKIGQTINKTQALDYKSIGDKTIFNSISKIAHRVLGPVSEKIKNGVDFVKFSFKALQIGWDGKDTGVTIACGIGITALMTVLGAAIGAHVVAIGAGLGAIMLGAIGATVVATIAFSIAIGYMFEYYDEVRSTHNPL